MRKARFCGHWPAPAVAYALQPSVRARFARGARSSALRTSTSALSNKLGTVILIKNINTSRNETLRSAVVKGLLPVKSRDARKHQRNRCGVTWTAAQRCPHNIGRIARKPSGSRLGVCSIRGLKAMSSNSRRCYEDADRLQNSLRLKAWEWLDAQSTITGAMTSAPVTSPSHQVTQKFAKFARSMYLVVARLVSPMCRDHDANQSKLRDRIWPRKRIASARPSIDQVSANNRFKRVANCGGNRAGGRRVGDHRRRGRGPSPISPQQHRRQRDRKLALHWDE